MEFAPVYLNSTNKTVINLEYDLDKYFQEILYRIDNQVNKESDWVIESVASEHRKSSIYSQLSGSTNIELPRRLKNSMKGLINIKNNENNCFLWCHIRHLSSLKNHPERIEKADKNMVNELEYKGI